MMTCDTGVRVGKPVHHIGFRGAGHQRQSGEVFASPTPYPPGCPERRSLKALVPAWGGTDPDALRFPRARRPGLGVEPY